MTAVNAAPQLYAGATPLNALYAGAVKVWPPAGAEWPTGIVTHWLGSVAPEGWAICDGKGHGSDELRAILLASGAANPDITPNLIDKFVRGAGTAAAGSTGGAASVALTAANMPSHDHDIGTESATHTHTGTSAGQSANATHTHTATSGTVSVWHVHSAAAQNTGGANVSHTHDMKLKEGVGEDADGGYVESNPDSQGTVRDIGSLSNNTINHVHARPAQTSAAANVTHTHAFTSGSASVEHTHTVTTGLASATHTHTVPSQGSGGAVPLVPPHFALIFIIKT